MKGKLFTLLLMGWIILVAYVSTLVWGKVQLPNGQTDPYAMIRYILRILVVVPLVTGLAIGAVKGFDYWTPGIWLTEEWNNEIARAMVLSTLIACIFWLGVQG